MNKKTLVSLLAVLFAIPVFAQTAKNAALTGFWIEKTDSMQEIKLISPTHVFFIVNSLVNDSAFAAGAGTYTASGNKYTENLEYATFDTKGIKATYDYSVQNNKLKQKGTLVLADGAQIPINHTFTRLEGAKQYPGNHVGTWNQVSSKFNTGTDSGSHTNATHIRYEIVTPTHWMRINMANGAFESAFGGTYTLTGNKLIANIDFTTNPMYKGMTAELTQRVEGNKMTLTGNVKDAQGKQFNAIEDVFERVTGTK